MSNVDNPLTTTGVFPDKYAPNITMEEKYVLLFNVCQGLLSLFNNAQSYTRNIQTLAGLRSSSRTDITIIFNLILNSGVKKDNYVHFSLK